MKYPIIHNTLKEQKLTVKKFTELLGVNRRRYYNYQSGSSIPSDLLIDMKRILGKSIDYLLGVDDE